MRHALPESSPWGAVLGLLFALSENSKDDPRRNPIGAHARQLISTAISASAGGSGVATPSARVFFREKGAVDLEIESGRTSASRESSTTVPQTLQEENAWPTMPLGPVQYGDR